MKDDRLVTLTGSKGIGKSSLACATAHFIHERALFKGGCIYVDGKNTNKVSTFKKLVIQAILKDSNHKEITKRISGV